jgi:hypothetical protein
VIAYETRIVVACRKIHVSSLHLVVLRIDVRLLSATLLHFCRTDSSEREIFELCASVRKKNSSARYHRLHAVILRTDPRRESVGRIKA